MLVTWPIVEFLMPLSYAGMLLIPVFGFIIASMFPRLFEIMFGETPDELYDRLSGEAVPMILTRLMGQSKPAVAAT